ARARCPACFRINRAAAGKTSRLPPRYAQGSRLRAALRVQRNQGSGQRPAERKRNRALGVVSAGALAVAYATRRYRVRLFRGQNHVRRHWREMLDLPGRNSPAEKARAAASRRADWSILKFVIETF